jgi:phospholipid/cholesterol/gamma-HCH transport system substrate-binding protein
MESDKRYFIEGLFIIGFTIAAALFAVWLGSPGSRSDIVYRIRFAESVSGLAVGDPVKFNGVDVGSVKTLAIDPDDARKVLVDVRLRKETPVKTDTRASLAMKGITGAVNIELNGGNPEAQYLAAVSPAGSIPEIGVEQVGLKAMLDGLPDAVAKLSKTADKFSTMAERITVVANKFSKVGDQTKQVMENVDQLTEKVKANPSLLLRRPKDPPKEQTAQPAQPAQLPERFRR